MGETSKLLGRMLDHCQELVEGFKEGQRAQESITGLEDEIYAVRELGSLVLPTALQRSCARDPAAAPDVGSRCTQRKLEVQDLIYGLQKFEIGQNDGAGHVLTTVDLNHRRECHTVAAGDGETRGAGSGRASTNPGRPSQKDPLTPFQRASRCSKTRGNSRRQRDRDGNDPPPQRRSKSRLNQSIGRLPFACPYYYYNKEEHQNCLNYELNRIVDVRQHIYRFHVQPSHCPRCGIEFQNDPIYAQRDAHVNQQICELTSSVFQYSGATSDQLGSMSNAAAHGHGSNDIERWYTIWNILFPGAAHPSSPYINVTNERSRMWVHAAIDNYQQNGGLADFIRMCDVHDASGVLNWFLDHFRNFVGGVNSPNPHDALSDATIEARSIIPSSPSPPSTAPWDQSHSLLASQPTVSSRSNLPVLLPRLTHTDSASFRTQDQGHGSAHTGRLFPNPNPNLDAADENYQS